MKRHSLIYQTIFTIFLLLLIFANLKAAPISFDVSCSNTSVGTVNVDTYFEGIIGGFDTMTNAGSINSAAATCGAHHFNWYQILTVDTDPLSNRAGDLLTVPYVDVPPSGYDLFDDPTWSDNLPWYYDEYSPSTSEQYLEPYLLLSSRTTEATLEFDDFPFGDFGLNLSFKTWLVGLNEDSSFHSFYDGFSWDYLVSEDGSFDGVTNIFHLGTIPDTSEYEDIIGGFATSTAVPLPSAFYLFITGAGFLITIMKKRKLE